MHAKTNPQCPKCGSTEKRFPPGRQDAYHVFCDNCGYDFGRFDSLQASFNNLLDELEAHLKSYDTKPAPDDKPKGE